MGIHGLTSFIDNNPHLLKDHCLHNCRVIIDGNNFYHFMYSYCKVRFEFGGDYDVYERKVRMIFSTFKTCNIEPFVVFDGAYTVDGRKYQTTISRARDRIYTAQRISNGQRGVLIPCLTQITFRQTLDMMNIPHVTCDFEADNQIVALANQWNCPVISNDSDFYIFDLVGGFIPLDYIDFRPKHCREFESSPELYLLVQFYHVDEFISCFPSLKRSVLPLFATMVGNDYMDSKAFEMFYNKKKKTPKLNSRRYSASKKHGKIIAILYWLEDKGECEELIPQVMSFIHTECRQKVEKLLMNSICGYKETRTFESFNLKEFFEGKHDAATLSKEFLLDYNCSTLPDWFVHALRCGKIPVFLLNVILLHRVILQTQVESMAHPASFVVSRPLREIIYGILLNSDYSECAMKVADKELSGSSHTHDIQSDSENNHTPTETTRTNALSSVGKQCGVEEYTRHNLELRKILVKPMRSLPRYGDLPTLEAVSCLSLSQKRAIIMETMGVSEEFCKKFDPSLQLFFMSLILWLRVASPKATIHHVKGILLSALLLHVHKEISNRKSKTNQVLRVDSEWKTDQKANKETDDSGVEESREATVAELKVCTENVNAPDALHIVKSSDFIPEAEVYKTTRLAEDDLNIGTKTEFAPDQAMKVNWSSDTGLRFVYDSKNDLSDEVCNSSFGGTVHRDTNNLFVSHHHCPLSAETMQNGSTCSSKHPGTFTFQRPKIPRECDTSESSPVMSIADTCSSASNDTLEKISDNLKKYYHEPINISSKNPSDHQSLHRTAQFLACLHDSFLLNCVLCCPFQDLQPASLVNGTFVYSIVQEFEIRSNPELFLLEMLVKGSVLAKLFESLCSAVLSFAGNDTLEEKKTSGKKCCKSSKKRKNSSRTVSSEGFDSTHFLSELGNGKELIMSCELSNRFGVLLLDDVMYE